MKRFVKALLLVLMLLCPVTTAYAASDKGASVVATVEEPVIFQDTITVDHNGGRYQVGFINIEFKKKVLDSHLLPATFDVEIYAENGQVYIEFTPDTPAFYKKVHLRVASYNGYIYDKALGKNVYVTVKKQQILAEHFSRYAVGY